MRFNHMTLPYLDVRKFDYEEVDGLDNNSTELVVHTNFRHRVSDSHPLRRELGLQIPYEPLFYTEAEVKLPHNPLELESRNVNVLALYLVSKEADTDTGYTKVVNIEMGRKSQLMRRAVEEVITTTRKAIEMEDFSNLDKDE